MRPPLVKPLGAYVLPTSLAAHTLIALRREGPYIERIEIQTHDDRLYADEETASQQRWFKRDDGVQRGYTYVSAINHDHDARWFEMGLTDLGEALVDVLGRGGVWSVAENRLDVAATLAYYRGIIATIDYPLNTRFAQVENAVAAIPELAALLHDLFLRKLLVWTPAA